MAIDYMGALPGRQLSEQATSHSPAAPQRMVAGSIGITYGNTMSTVKVAISIDVDLLKGVDSLVGKRVFPSRSRAIAEAVREKLERFSRGRLARECAKLDLR
jgi:hypothetical protein